MPWGSTREFEAAWLGALGEGEELAAEEHLEACLDGEYDADIQAEAVELARRFDSYLAEGGATGGELAGQLLEEGGLGGDAQEVGPDELAEAEARAQELGPEAFEEDEGWDQATALIAAEMERLAGHKGAPLTQGEAKRVIASLPMEAFDGGVVPDFVKEFGDQVKDRSDRQTRVERGAEAAQKLQGEPDKLTVTPQEAGNDEDRRDRLERGVRAVAAVLNGSDEGSGEEGEEQ